MRAVMRSAAKLSYEEAQAAIDGKPSEKCEPLMETALEPLWRAYAALKAAREERAPLDLDLPERRVLLDKEGRVDRIVVPERLEAHRLIEEMMIQANVAAAETLEQQKAPVVYRAHEPPSKEKLTQLRDFLGTLGLKLPGAGQLKPGDFNRVLAAAKGQPVAELVNEVVLRSQSQADYRPVNAGHFGLHLVSLRAFHLADPALRRSDRAPLADHARCGSARAGSTTTGRQGSRRSASRSRRPSAARWRPSARPSTGWSPRIWPTGSARSSPRASRA